MSFVDPDGRQIAPPPPVRGPASPPYRGPWRIPTPRGGPIPPRPTPLSGPTWILPEGTPTRPDGSPLPDPNATANGYLDALEREKKDASEGLYRSMTRSGTMPEVGRSRRKLGIVPDGDIPVVDGMVSPQTGGMSVSRGSPFSLPDHRRPPEFGGEGKDPVWRIQEHQLGGKLRLRMDSRTHGLVEPATKMCLAEYEKALEETRPSWVTVLNMWFYGDR